MRGGNRLEGDIEISGAKNAAVAILPCAIVSGGRCVVDNLPEISDVRVVESIIKALGASIDRVDSHTLQIDGSDINTCSVPHELSRSMRASYYFIGALLSRFGEAHVPLPGGCNLGARPINQHLDAFAALGCDVSVDYGTVNVSCKNGMHGAQIFFDKVSVGSTINAMLAAVRAEGRTVLENVAKEPHIVDVANFLNSMGADIRGAGTDVIKIRGVKELHGSSYSIIPDQIEAGTYMATGLATGGDLLIRNITPKHLESICVRMEAAGAEITEYDDALRIRRVRPLRSTSVKTMPHPGFPTDMQPQMATVLSVANGTSIITEDIWENRFKYVDELRRMGASIQVKDDKVAVVEGVAQLHGARVHATDLRAGAAMIIAGLIARGETEILDIYHIERGYENIAEKLTKVGGNIKKVTDAEPEERQNAAVHDAL